VFDSLPVLDENVRISPYALGTIVATIAENGRPDQPDAVQSGQAGIGERALRGKSRILIVDDSPHGRETLSSLLMNVPEYELFFAADGPEALIKIEELVPDLVLLDVMMPGMSGFDVCRQVRQQPRLSEIPIILVTALDDRESRLEGLDAGADDFVTKPIDRAELRVRVRTVTRLNRYRLLNNERTRFEWVVEHANDGYLILGDQGQLMYANQSARLLLEFPDEVEPAISFFELVQRRFRCEPEQAWHDWFGPEHQIPPHSLYLICPETDTSAALWLQVTVLAQETRSGLEQLVHVRDITAQLTNQRDTWTFHAMIMHKLNTPMQSVLGGLELISDEAVGEMPREELAALAQVAHKGAQRLGAAVADVIRYLKAPLIARGGDGLKVSQICDLIKQISQDLAIATKIQMADTVPASAFADKSVSLSQRALESLLLELLKNAQKFHPRRQPVVEVSLRPGPASTLDLAIADNGITLSPEQLAKVWLPYYQAEKHFTGEQPGMGLGLPMISVLVWEVGGRCRFRNREPGPGVVVELSLPLR
jgi:two-component system cell cycle response regulator